MIKIIAIGWLLLAVSACRSPVPVTGNPDKLTTTSGTAGSSKMSSELPGKMNGGMVTDTNKIKGPVKIDSLKPKKDTVPM